MPLRFCMPRLAWSVLLVPALLSGLIFAGCDSSAPTGDAEKQTELQKENMKKAEAAVNDAAKKGGKAAPTFKLGGKPGAGVGKVE
jgi:hypothetical protein